VVTSGVKAGGFNFHIVAIIGDSVVRCFKQQDIITRPEKDKKL
jgi:hypothetical protein